MTASSLIRFVRLLFLLRALSNLFLRNGFTHKVGNRLPYHLLLFHPFLDSVTAAVMLICVCVSLLYRALILNRYFVLVSADAF